MHCGTGVTMARDGVLAEWLRWVVLIASGSLDVATGMRFNRGTVQRLRPRRAGAPRAALPSPVSRPELPRVVGQVPAVALAAEIEAGNVRALFVTGGNPLTAFPQPERLHAALRTLEVLAVVDVADNPLTEIATHVLPATGQLERADITLAELTALRSALQATPAVVSPVADRRPVWWMFAALSRAMGRAPAGTPDPDDLGDEDYLRGVLAHRARRRRPSLRGRTTRRRDTCRIRMGAQRTARGRSLVDRARTTAAPTGRVQRSRARAVRARAAPGDGVEQLDRLRRGRE